jgi:hypothetical protein
MLIRIRYRASTQLKKMVWRVQIEHKSNGVPMTTILSPYTSFKEAVKGSLSNTGHIHAKIFKKFNEHDIVVELYD